MTEKYRVEYFNLLVEKFLPKFLPLGFKKKAKVGLIATNSLFKDKIWFLVEQKYYSDENIFGNTFNYYFERRFDIVESYWEEYLEVLKYNVNPIGYECSTIKTSHFSLEYPENYWTKRYNIDSNKYKNIDEFIEEFWNDYSTKMLPIMNSTDTIKKMDLIVNYENIIPRRIFNGTGGLMKRMIIAKLAGNPNYEKVCQEVLEAIELKKETEPKKYDGFKYVYGEIIKKLESVEEYIQ